MTQGDALDKLLWALAGVPGSGIEELSTWCLLRDPNGKIPDELAMVEDYDEATNMYCVFVPEDLRCMMEDISSDDGYREVSARSVDILDRGRMMTRNEVEAYIAKMNGV